MKHAGDAALAGLGVLLAQLRRRPGLVEKRPGVFYRAGQAFLHFHEDAAGMFVDIKDGGEWLRMPVGEAAGWSICVKEVDRLLALPLRA